MRQALLTLTLLTVFHSAYSQSIIQRTSGTNTIIDPRLQASQNFILPVYADTIAANLQKGVDSSGAIIKTGDSTIYMRGANPRRWVRVTGRYLVSTVAALPTLQGVQADVPILTTDLAGEWYYDPSDTSSVDNYGTVRVNGTKRIKRILTGAGLMASWFGLDGVNDQVAINKALGTKPVKVILDPNYIYKTSGPIRMTAGQTLEGNKATIQSTSTTNVIEGQSELLSNIYQHNGAIINDITIKSATAKDAINLKGFKFSKVNNITLSLTNIDTTKTGIHFQHGSQPYEQCYFNEVNNPNIYLDGPGTAMLFDGVDTTSGANINTVKGGSVSGMDRYSVRMANHSVGNTIERLDAEHYNPSTGSIAYKIETSLNSFIAPHIENYATGFSFSSTASVNKIIGISTAGVTTLYSDLGGDNIYDGVNASGSGSISIGQINDLSTYTKLRLAGINYPSLRIDSRNTDPLSRNWALRAGFSGSDFDFMRSNAQGGDPVSAGTSMWRINAQGHFVLPQQIQLTGMTQYNTNAIAVANGWADGFFYSSPDGMVRIVKAGGATGMHVEPATAPDHAVALQMLRDSIALSGPFISSGSNIYNRVTGSLGVNTNTPSSTLDVRSTTFPAEITVGQTGSATGKVVLGYNYNTGRTYIKAHNGYLYITIDTSGTTPIYIRKEGFVVGANAVYNSITPPQDGVYSQGEVRAANATTFDHVVAKNQLDSTGKTVVHLAGLDTITGAKNFTVQPTSITPTSPSHVAIKSYVDSLSNTKGGGSVTSVATNNGTGITGGTITTTGTLANDTTNVLSTKAYRQKGLDSAVSLINTKQNTLSFSIAGTGAATLAGSTLTIPYDTLNRVSGLKTLYRASQDSSAIMANMRGTVKVLPDANYTVTSSDRTLILTTPAATRTLTLPAASTMANQEVNIQCRATTTGAWMLSGSFVSKGTTGSNPIAENFVNSGLATGTNYRLFSDGNKWYEQ